MKKKARKSASSKITPVRSYYLGDQEAAKKKAEAVAAQSKAA